MKIVETTFERLPRERLEIGFEGENQRATVRVDCASVFAEYPNATPALIVKPLFADAYPVVVDRNGTCVDWLITSEILSFTGDGNIQLTFVKDQVICKSAIAKICVSRSLQVTGDMPDPVAQWVDDANAKLAEVDAQIVELEGMVDTATDAAERAEQSASTASTAAEQAAGSAATATEKATEATNAAGTATAKAAEAQTAAQTATEKATAAAESERIATAKAGEATTAATTATAKAEQATEAAQTATGKAGEASASATAAQTSATNAASSAQAASASETAAGASATQAAQSAQNASTAAQTATQKAEEATQSATNAETFAGTATTKAEEAAESAQAAQDAQTAVEQTAEQLADSLEQIEQNTQDIAELDERKANIDGYYPDMTVGNAEQLNSSKFVENSEPYTLRTSGGSADIGNREYVDAVVGGTVAWNQAVRDEASENSTDFAEIVTVTDAVEDAAGVKVKLEPVQDLHGYDHPWPGGGGKNLLHVDSRVSATVAGVTYTSDDDYVYLNGTKYGQGYVALNRLSISLEPGTYYARAFAVGGTSTNQIYIYANNGNADFGGDILSAERTYTIAETTTVVFRFLISVDGTALSNYKIGIVISKTSGIDVFYPYSNICPITGWDGVKVTRTGKNLIDKSNGKIGNNGGRGIAFGSVSYSDSTPDGSLVLPAGDYTISLSGVNSTAAEGIYIRNTTRQFKVAYNTKMCSFSLSEKQAIRIGILIRVADFVSWDNYDIQLELGSTATDYEPYAGQTYDITLPTEAGTVYGGTLDVSTGELVVDRVSVVADDAALKRNPANWYNVDTSHNRGSFGIYFYWNDLWLTSVFPLPDNNKRLMAISDSFVNAGGRGVYDNELVGHFYIHQTAPIYFGIRVSSNDLADTSSAEAVSASAMTYLHDHPIQLCYYIANPITYTLTPTEIRTLLGTNNVWADTGDLALTYTGTDEHLTLESGKKYLTRLSGTDSMLLGSGQEITAAKGQDNVFDLTQMFGTAVADYVYGQGASFFRRWFPKSVYPYNAGELRHVEGLQSHDMVGFNLWDEEWENGIYNNQTGEPVVSVSNIRSKNAIRVFPNTQYFMNVPYSSNVSGFIVVLYYDANDSYTGNLSSLRANGQGFVTPSNACYARFYVSSLYGATYEHDICLSLAHNGSRNGEYEPYVKHSYPLDSSVILRGIPKVGANGVYWDGDRYLPDGTVERKYGVVDLGTVNWLYRNSLFDGSLPNGKLTSTRDGGILAVCLKYTVFPLHWSSLTDGQACVGGGYVNSSTCSIVVKDSAYTDAAAFKAAMSGVYLVYELATPTTETAQPYHSTQWVSDWGTEEFVSTGLVPVGHETRYPANLRDKLQHLPDAASGNGSYLITQTDGQMTLTPFPAPPSTAGNYVLKATVTGGVATYTWEVAT